MKSAEFDYKLSRELIAQEPLPDRSRARMMVVHRDTGRFEHRRVSDVTEYLEFGDLLVVNDTRVIPARVFGHRTDTGGKVELLLLEEENEPEARDQRSEVRIENKNRKLQIANRKSYEWDALYHASGRPQLGTSLSLAGDKLQAEITEVKKEGRVTLKLSSDRPLLDILEEEGFAPVPPYIKRKLKLETRNLKLEKNDVSKEFDRERYQTIYARHPGAVAAPTAGLHFTLELFKKLERQGVHRTAVTLHVGAGTFKPVKTEMVEDHVMEDERYVVSEEAAFSINTVRRADGRIVAIGSTVVRTLETVAAEHGSLTPCSGRSSLFIYPPYEFKIVNAMLTNFHLPKSSLIMMVSAFACPSAVGGSTRAGRDLIFRAYKEAIRQKYRFYSYGDCMLIL